MTTARDPLLQRSIDAMAVPGILIDHRLIAIGDESALLPEEFRVYASSVIKVRRASGAARIVARELFLRLGHAQRAIPKSASGMPIWPNGIVGSLARRFEVAVATMAMRRDFSSLGVDIEPAKALDPELLDLVTTATERQRLQDDLAMAVFSSRSKSCLQGRLPTRRHVFRPSGRRGQPGNRNSDGAQRAGSQFQILYRDAHRRAGIHF